MSISALILDEGKWLVFSMLVAAGVAAAAAHRAGGRAPHERRQALLDAAFGTTIGTMAAGHLLAVGVKVAQGTLAGNLWVLVPLGLVLAVPAWWLVLAAFRARAIPAAPASVGPTGVAPEGPRPRATVVLCACTIVALLALGVHNAPLAAPGAFALAHALARHPGWRAAAFVGGCVVYAALFVGGVVFAASGQSFEQFRGLPQPAPPAVPAP